MFRVQWQRSAVDELARLWLHENSAQRQAMTAAAHAIEQQLRKDPFGASESRPEGQRILLVSPLGVTFQIEADEQTISVLRVWIFRSRGQQ